MDYERHCCNKSESSRYFISVRTKIRPTKRAPARNGKKKVKAKSKEQSTPWREVFKEELKKYGEAVLMLRGSRHKAELTQKELADAIGIS